MVITCAHCGQANEPDARFCRSCGNPLSNPAGEPVPRQEFTISVPVGILRPEMIVTAIAWYMAFSAFYSLFTSFFLFFMSLLLEGLRGLSEALPQIGGELPHELSRQLQLRSGFVVLLGWLLTLMGVLEGAAATGLFRGRRWALGLTKVMLIVSAVIGLLSLMLSPSSSSVVGMVVSAGIAVAVWVYFNRPEVRGYFHD